MQGDVNEYTGYNNEKAELRVYGVWFQWHEKVLWINTPNNLTLTPTLTPTLGQPVWKLAGKDPAKKQVFSGGKTRLYYVRIIRTYVLLG